MNVVLASARITLKQHRFEVGVGALAAIALSVWALSIGIRTGMITVPPGCFDMWLSAGPDGAGECAASVRAWGLILAEEGTMVIEAMAYVPFAIGLVAGVPIVARELESRTAQTAWSLNGSRIRWLLRQLAPVLLLLGASVTVLALTTAALEADRVLWAYSPVEDLGQYGPLIATRAFGAFGLGLLVGALMGRTLPAFVLGAVLTITLSFGMGLAREAWLDRVDPEVVGKSSAGSGDLLPGAVITGVAWRTPDGEQISIVEASALAHAAGAAQPASEDVQDGPAIAWLEQHGYVEVAIGVTRDMALAWGLYDALGYGLVGSASIAGTILIVRQKRPA